MKRVIKIPPPPFMQGGKVVPGDLVVRDPAGYPLDSDGNIDLQATKLETMKHLHKVVMAKKSGKASNFTPPKKRKKC